jgi:hypothetical protein
VGAIKQVEAVADVVDRLEAEYRSACQRLAALAPAAVAKAPAGQEALRAA